MGMTIGNVQRLDCVLTAYCTRDMLGVQDVMHSGRVDVDLLAARFGPDADLYGKRVQAAMRCQQCGRRGAVWQMHPRETLEMGPGFMRSCPSIR